MTTKYQMISMLAEETAKQIARNGQEWMKYLDTAARLYKYPFNEQMLIYAQRPDASACASLETWNEKMNCWVNRGAKGIALIDTDSERPRLKYVFDVSDVHKARRIGRDPYLWELREEHKDVVLARLENIYGETDAQMPFEKRLIELAERIASDYYEELLPEIGYVREGSFLEELDELNVGIRLRDTLASSIAYTILSRCGADMEQWKEELDFDNISEFNTTKTLSVLGSATTEMCKPLLMEIGNTIRAYDRQTARKRAEEKAALEQSGTILKNAENLDEIPLANTAEADYNALKRESETQIQNETETTDHKETEGIANETDIREERGLSDPEPDAERGAGTGTHEVRADEKEILAGTPERDLSGHGADGRAESTLPSDTGAGRAENGLPDTADGKSRGSGRGTESSRSDEMGGTDEQHQTFSGGNRADGADLQLENSTQQNKEQQEPDSENNSLSGSFLDNDQAVPNEDVTGLRKGILCSDEFLIHKRPEIAGYFAMEQDTRLQTEYFRNCFPFGTYYALDVAGTSVGFHAGEEGLYINMTGKAGAENETLLSWEDARFLVNSYMEDGVYLLPGEVAEQIDMDGMYKQLDLFTMFSEQVGNIAMKQAEEVSKVPPAMPIPQEQLDAILRSGGGRDNSRKRIYAKYCQGKTPEEMAEFLKKEYGTTGKGFEFDGKQTAVWFDEQGMTAGYGTSALENPRFTMSWKELETQIRSQVENGTYTVIKEKQAELNSLYDAFSKKYGLINSQTNKRAFNQDSSYCLLCSLEKLDDEGNFKGKADMFTKRTIKKAEVVTSVDTAAEALAVSLSEKARVDLDYMAELSGKSTDTIKEELTGVIFNNPVTDKWETADEYLSGNVRDKLETAKVYAENHPEYAVNVQALTQVQPKELDASEIEVRIGATWIKPEYLEDFMRDTFETPQHLFDRNIMGVQFSDVTGQWNVKGKNADYGNALVNMTYGTSRRNAYQILEDSLNLKDSRVYDTIEEDGKEKRVLNKKETTLAAQKQDTIREAFKDWVFRDPDRRQDLVAKYNKLFNSTRPREYDGSHLKFPGMTPDIELKPHQKSAVAHVLYGDNTLLAHCVGAGKTFEMTAAAMESKRLGLCQKSLFVVPNHLTEQWASDFLRLYPGANILAATKKDFEPANRKKFCSRIATGDYDAVIIGHSQFEKIPLSQERQAAMIERQIDEIETAIAMAKADNGERYTIKQMEKSRKALQTRLEKLNDTSRKDNVVTFEQLGVDRLFVDESHNYKNLFLYTKMRNVAGIAQTEAQKSSDMFAKCQYLDEITGGKGVTFATGTPISNSMTELYTNMRYLQYGTLQKLGLGHFDSWASSFGETQTAIELAPEGTGYRAKTRFAKFFNLPELISLFKESADIQTPDMLKLPVPEAEYENVVLKPSEYQQDMVASLAERAEAVRDRKVDAAVDNMLKITNDGRKLALDQRLINDMLPDDENSKASTCVRKAFEIWEQTKEQKSTQLIFCDLSTPKGDGTFNVYDDIKNKLIGKGVPPEEIAFIHNANTETRKAELFAKVRSGQVRFLLGSTQKMGAGTNVQDRLIALHHLDVPWRPSDIEQQEGRILRQGNMNPKVKIYRYVTENTFDSYSWQLIENKQKFIGQIMTSKSPVRSCEDVDEAALTYAEVKALATGNPYIKEKMDLDIQVSKLKLMKANHTSQKYRLEDNIAKHYPQQIAILKERISGMQADIQTAKAKLPADKEQFFMKVGDKAYTDKKEAGAALVEMCKEMKTVNVPATVGEYAGFKMAVSFDSFNHKFVMNLKGQLSHNLEIGSDPLGNIARINHALESMPKQLAEAQTKLENVEHQLETAKAEVQKPFSQEQELAEKLDRLSALNALLNMDEKGNDGIGMEDEPETSEGDREVADRSAKNIPLAEKLTDTGQNKGGRQYTDVPAARVSLKEKLEAFKVKAAEGDADKATPKKAKDKAEIL